MLLSNKWQNSPNSLNIQKNWTLRDLLSVNNCRESTQKPSKPELMEYKYTRDDNVEGEHRMITLIIQISTHSNKAKWSFTLCAVGCLQYTEMWLMSTHTCHTHTDLYVICDRFQSQLVFLNLAIICFGLTDVSLCCEFMTSYRVLLVSTDILIFRWYSE